MPTKQETFDTMVNHLRQQKRKCENDEICLYHGDNGMKCAVGALIPDSEYTDKMEGNKITLTSKVGAFLDREGHDLVLCKAVQRIHDNNDPANWEHFFQQVAANQNLVYTPPQ